MSTYFRTWMIFGSLVVAAIGCSQQQSTTSRTSTTHVDSSKYLLATEPEAGKDVIQVRADAQNEDEVVVIGRIGGSVNPWVEGRAAFSIVDASLKACSDREGDDCPQPWDYCCETDRLPTSKLLVTIVDNQGKLVPADARELLNVKELQTVVVRGTAKRDDAGNLTVLASGVYVRK